MTLTWKVGGQPQGLNCHFELIVHIKKQAVQPAIVLITKHPPYWWIRKFVQSTRARQAAVICWARLWAPERRQPPPFWFWNSPELSAGALQRLHKTRAGLSAGPFWLIVIFSRSSQAKGRPRQHWKSFQGRMRSFPPALWFWPLVWTGSSWKT